MHDNINVVGATSLLKQWGKQGGLLLGGDGSNGHVSQCYTSLVNCSICGITTCN
jgi:hypothetical protein